MVLSENLKNKMALVVTTGLLAMSTVASNAQAVDADITDIITSASNTFTAAKAVIITVAFFVIGYTLFKKFSKKIG